MAIRKGAGWWVVLLSLPLFCIVATVIAAKLYFTSSRLKELILPGIRRAIDREVNIKDISLSVFPSPVVEVESITVSGPRGGSFRRNDFASVDDLTLRIKALGLFRGRIDITSAIIDHPRIYLELTNEGSKNYLLHGSATGENRVETESSSPFIVLANIQIKNGEIERIDEKVGGRIVVKGLDLTTSIVGDPANGQSQITGEMSIRSISYGSLRAWYMSDQPLSGHIMVSYDRREDALSIDSARVQIREFPLSIRGIIKNLMKDTNNVGLTVSSSGAPITQLLSLLPSALLTQSRGLTGTGEVKFAMTVQGESAGELTPAIEGSFTLLHGKIQYSSLANYVSNINVRGSFAQPAIPSPVNGGSTFRIDEFTADIGGNPVSGQFRIENFSDPTVFARIEGTLNLGDLKDIFPLKPETEITGKIDAKLSASGKLQHPNALKSSGFLTFQNVTFKPSGTASGIRDLSGSISLNNDVIHTNNLSLRMGESDLSPAFTLRNYLAILQDSSAPSLLRPVLEASLRSKRMRISDLALEGPISTADRSAMSQRWGDRIGFFRGTDIHAKVEIGQLQAKELTLNKVEGLLTFSRGVGNLKNLTFNVFDGTVQTTGMLDFRAPTKIPFTLDLKALLIQAAPLLSGIIGNDHHCAGRITSNTSLKGGLNDTLGLDPNSLSGSGMIKIADGTLGGFALTQKLAEFTNLTELREIKFRNWTNAFSIFNGSLDIRDLVVTTPVGDFKGSGTQHLEGSLDYNLKLRLTASVSQHIASDNIAGRVLEFFKDKEGRVTIPLRITGPVVNPVVKLDAGAEQDAMRDALLRKTDAAKEDLENKINKAAEERLKKLFKRP